ncbi:MAG: NmrA/HSCARG family protein [Ferruginibacter sp.]|nr:NmrA/HSCARG family protein [Ferruginibacter sp.]
MSDKKTILVTGATGAQGGSVARYLMEDGQFAVRALTRNVDSAKAIALRDAGAEVVTGDLNDVASLEAAMQGCYGVFGVTNFWEHFDNESAHGKNLVDAVVKTGVDHFIYSSLRSAVKESNGELKVPHLDIKAELEEYAKKVKPDSSFVHVAFYYENFLSFFPPQKGEDGSFSFGFPQGETKLAAVSVDDIGGVVTPMFKAPETYKGKTVGVVGDDLPVAEYAANMGEVLNKTVHYNHIPREQYAAFGFPGAEELANMFEFNRLYILHREEDLKLSRSLDPSIRSFKQWVQENKDQFASMQ